MMSSLKNKNIRPEDLLCYAVTDRHWIGDKTLSNQVEEALQGGVTCLQYREKHLSNDAFLEEAKELQTICKQYHVPFIINDRVELAIQCDADGIHVGQDDMVASVVREKIGPHKILGVSAQTVEQAIMAEQQGADYLGVGAVFGTSTKADAVEVTLETLKDICQAVSIPVVAIGGVKENNVNELAGTGIVGVAVVSAIFGQKNIQQATVNLKNAVKELTK